MNRSKQPTSDPSEWQSCPEGELQQLGQRLTAKRRSERLSSAAHVGAWSLLLVAVGVFLGGLTMSDRSPTLPGGITCAACFAEMESYHAHLIGQQVMPETQAEQVQAHLAACEICGPKFEAMYPGVLAFNPISDNASNSIHRLQLAINGKTHLPTAGLLAAFY